MRSGTAIEVVLLAPPREHALAGALRTVVERVARRPGVRLCEAAPGQGEAAWQGDLARGGPRFVVGLEVSQPAACTLMIALQVVGEITHSSSAPLWTVPPSAFDRPIDGLERVQRLGSVLAACLDLAGSDEGRQWLASDAVGGSGVTCALAGTAHLSAAALQDALARQMSARAAVLLVASLEEGRDWEAEDWALPPELDVRSVVAALAGAARPDEVAATWRERALGAAERLEREVADAVDRALATHGLAAVIPLQAAIERLMRSARAPVDLRRAVIESPPSDALVRACEGRLGEQPRPVPGSVLLALGWAAPSGALAGLALGPAAAPSLVGAGHALFAAIGAGLFLALAGITRAYTALRSRVLQRALAAARHDYESALNEAARARSALRGPEIIGAALSWLRDRLTSEQLRLRAIEAQVRSPLRAAEEGGVASLAGAAGIDSAVELAAARRLFDPAPDPLVQRVRSELGGNWRSALPTLLDLVGAAQAATIGPGGVPWVERSDIAQAIVTPLRDALDRVERGLARWVPRGMPARRMAFLPAPFRTSELGLSVDATMRCVGDAHLLLLWRAT